MSVAREFDTGSGPRNLANAIIAKAADDWRDAAKALKTAGPRKRKDLLRTMEECERFFLSEWFEQLAPGDLEGPVLLRMLQKEVEGGDPFER